MNRFLSSKPLMAAAMALGALAAASAAEARTDVSLSIGLPVGYVQPAPVYVQPQPVYVPARPVYVQPRPVYYGYADRGAWGDVDHDGVYNVYDRDFANARVRHEMALREADRRHQAALRQAEVRHQLLIEAAQRRHEERLYYGR